MAGSCAALIKDGFQVFLMEKLAFFLLSRIFVSQDLDDKRGGLLLEHGPLFKWLRYNGRQEQHTKINNAYPG